MIKSVSFLTVFAATLLSGAPLAAAVPLTVSPAHAEVRSPVQSTNSREAKPVETSHAIKLPEPESWALMLSGLFAVGSSLRRRRAPASFC